MSADVGRIGEPEQALVAPDGFYTPRLIREATACPLILLHSNGAASVAPSSRSKRSGLRVAALMGVGVSARNAETLNVESTPRQTPFDNAIGRSVISSGGATWTARGGTDARQQRFRHCATPRMEGAASAGLTLPVDVGTPSMWITTMRQGKCAACSVMPVTVRSVLPGTVLKVFCGLLSTFGGSSRGAMPPVKAQRLSSAILEFAEQQSRML